MPTLDTITDFTNLFDDPDPAEAEDARAWLSTLLDIAIDHRERHLADPIRLSTLDPRRNRDVRDIMIRLAWLKRGTHAKGFRWFNDETHQYRYQKSEPGTARGQRQQPQQQGAVNWTKLNHDDFAKHIGDHHGQVDPAHLTPHQGSMNRGYASLKRHHGANHDTFLARLKSKAAEYARDLNNAAAPPVTRERAKLKLAGLSVMLKRWITEQQQAPARPQEQPRTPQQPQQPNQRQQAPAPQQQPPAETPRTQPDPKPALSHHHENFLKQHTASIDSSKRLSPEAKTHYKKAMTRAVQHMPELAVARMLLNVTGVHYAADPSQFGDLLQQDVCDRIASTGAKMDRNHPNIRRAVETLSADGVRGCFIFGSGDVLLDGETERNADVAGGERTSTHETYVHELTHAIDGRSNKLSDTPEWSKAFASEIDQPAGGNPKSGRLSKYARGNTTEGFAEFGRLLYGTDVPLATVEKMFPQCSAFFKERNLWPTR